MLEEYSWVCQTLVPFAFDMARYFMTQLGVGMGTDSREAFLKAVLRNLLKSVIRTWIYGQYYGRFIPRVAGVLARENVSVFKVRVSERFQTAFFSTVLQ